MYGYRPESCLHQETGKQPSLWMPAKCHSVTAADAPLIAKSRYTAIGGIEMLADLSAQLGSKRTEHDFNVEFGGRLLCKVSNRPVQLLSIVHGVQANQGQVLAIRKCSLIEL